MDQVLGTSHPAKLSMSLGTSTVTAEEFLATLMRWERDSNVYIFHSFFSGS